MDHERYKEVLKGKSPREVARVVVFWERAEHKAAQQEGGIDKARAYRSCAIGVLAEVAAGLSTPALQALLDHIQVTHGDGNLAWQQVRIAQNKLFSNAAIADIAAVPA